MPSKESIIATLDKESYSLSEVKSLIHSVSEKTTHPPRTIRKGDVFTIDIGYKSRPCIVYKIKDNLAYSIPLSTTKDEMNLIPIKISRFTSEDINTMFFSKGIIIAPLDVVKKRYKFTYEYKKEIDIAVEIIKQII